MTDQERVDGLLRHINAVKENCNIIAEKFLANGKADLGRALIKVAQIHDNSKFSGIEWEFLTGINTTNRSGLKYAVMHHEATNPHHPRYWGSIEAMPDLFLAEMVCDWKARASEFGSDLRQYIDNDASRRFKFIKDGFIYKKIYEFVEILCPKPFEPIEDVNTIQT